MVLTEATGDAELVLWDGREFGHWLLEHYQLVYLTHAESLIPPLLQF